MQELAQSPALQPAVPQSNAPQPDGYIVEVGGKFVSEYRTLTAALSAGLKLKSQDRQAQVKVYDAKDRIPARAAN